MTKMVLPGSEAKKINIATGLTRTPDILQHCVRVFASLERVHKLDLMIGGIFRAGWFLDVEQAPRFRPQ